MAADQTPTLKANLIRMKLLSTNCELNPEVYKNAAPVFKLRHGYLMQCIRGSAAVIAQFRRQPEKPMRCLKAAFEQPFSMHQFAQRAGVSLRNLQFRSVKPVVLKCSPSWGSITESLIRLVTRAPNPRTQQAAALDAVASEVKKIFKKHLQVGAPAKELIHDTTLISPL